MPEIVLRGLLLVILSFEFGLSSDLVKDSLSLLIIFLSVKMTTAFSFVDVTSTNLFLFSIVSLDELEWLANALFSLGLTLLLVIMVFGVS